MFNVRITVQDCQVEVCATGRSLVQRSLTMCVCVSQCVIACDNHPNTHSDWVEGLSLRRKDRKDGDKWWAVVNKVMNCRVP